MADSAQETFLEESCDLLQVMEESLLQMEETPDDPELINGVFRAAHTIKGTGGVFGFTHVEAFTHVVENVLDGVRGGDIKVDSDLVALLLQCRDQIETLVLSAVNDETEPKPDVAQQGEALLKKLRAYLATESSQVSVVESRVEVMPSGQFAGNDNWHLSLNFFPEVLQNGMDPMSFLRYLSKLGEVVDIFTIYDELPDFADLDPELCYLGFEVVLQTEADKKQIEQVFDFVKEMSRIHILPPLSQIERYAALIEDMEEDGDLRVGEMLQACGAVTGRELEEALHRQRDGGTEAPQMPLGEVLIEQGAVRKDVVEAALNKQQNSRQKQRSRSRMLRVDADKLDCLINQVGELVISGASSTLRAQKLGDEDLLESIAQMAHLVEEIRDSALDLRMVQIGETFSRFQRVVRDVSKEIGKNIKLDVAGADTELDKTVVDKIGDPLMHLVRNAMDHGIESVQHRVAAGKPEQGTVKLNAFHDSGSIVIEVSDDGNGLSKERILAKALEKGLLDSAHNLTDGEIYRLIFEPGFSTADKVTNLSGRGVGMDVVRRNIEALRGTVDVSSEPGQGSTISIRLPLTLAIIDGFLVGVGASSYVVPLDMVIECVELEAEEQRASKTQNYINLRGDVLPFLRLRELFDEQGRTESQRENIVVVQFGKHRAGLVVDELLGEFQTVIKPMGKVLQKLKGISGATILGSGNVAVILDVPNLLERAGTMGRQHRKGLEKQPTLH